MPIYEYRCRDCGETLEVMQKITAGPLRKCRSCSGKLEKLISRTSFLLKGGGWFDSGYTNGSKGKSTPAESTPAESTPAKSIDSSGSKTKTEAKKATA